MGAVNNFLSAMIHLFIMSLIIFFAAPAAFGAKVPENLPIYFICLAIFIIVSLSVGTVLGLYVKGTAKLTMFSQIIFLPSLMLSGIMFPTSLLPKAFGYVGKIFPATWGFAGMNSTVFELNLLLPLLVVFIAAAVVSCIRLLKIGVE
jgi:ABC-2 type transport system permease protein